LFRVPQRYIAETIQEPDYQKINTQPNFLTTLSAIIRDALGIEFRVLGKRQEGLECCFEGGF